MKLVLSLLLTIVSAVTAYSQGCCVTPGEFYTVDCGCVPASFKCCTAAEKATAQNTYQTSIEVCAAAYLEQMDIITTQANDTRQGLTEANDAALATIGAEKAACFAVCVQANPGNDAIDTVQRIACQAGCTAVATAAESAVTVSYYAMIAAANVNEASQVVGATAAQVLCNSNAQSTKDAACDNWS